MKNSRCEARRFLLIKSLQSSSQRRTFSSQERSRCRSRSTSLRSESLEQRIVLASTIVFNEIMFNPAGSDQTSEWIELYNQNAVDMDVSGWRIDGGVRFDFPPDSIIPAGGYAVIAADPEAAEFAGLENRYGPFEGRLSNGGEALRLLDNFYSFYTRAGIEPGEHSVGGNDGRRIMDSLAFDDSNPWPVAADGSGASLAKQNEDAGADPSNWASIKNGGTPGAKNTAVQIETSTLAINEIRLGNTNAFQVELFNHGDAPIDLGGIVLTAVDSQTDFALPAQTLGSQEFFVVDETSINNQWSAGDALVLFTPNKSSVIDSVRIEPGIGRYPDGTGRWLRTESFTFGGFNRIDLENALVINEIMFNAYPTRTAETAFEVNSAEWIEIHNRSADRTISLTGWSLKSGINFEFPDQTAIAPGQFLVVSNESTLLKFEYPSLADRIIGDFVGSLGNRSDSIELVDQNGNSTDIVTYFDGGRWPEYADAGGSSLELIDPRADNSKAESWAASNERAKSEWRNVEYIGTTVDDGVGLDIWDEFVFGLLDAGEILIDDVSVLEYPNAVTPTELLQNGDFEEDTIGASPQKWRSVGNHGILGQSVIEQDPDDPNNKVFHVVATGETRDVDNHVETTLTIENRSPPAERENIYSVDLQAIKNGVVRTTSGPDDFTGFGGQWNPLNVPDRGLVTDAGISTLVNNLGQTSDIGFAFEGTVSALVRGSDRLLDDSVFVNGGDADEMVSWAITGLEPGSIYQLYVIGGDVIRREAQITVDRDGDGDLTNEMLVIAGTDGALIGDLVAGPEGTLSGVFTHGNWAGFHLVKGEFLVPLPPPITEGIIGPGREYKISFRAKWLAGSNQLNTRLYFNWLQETTLLDVPSHNGTPGRRNSQAIDNSGPTYEGFGHMPVVPFVDQAVSVVVSADDPDGVAMMTLWYSVRERTWASVPMERENGRYVGTIPGQAAGQAVQFYVEGQDDLGAKSYYPAAGEKSRAMYEVADGRAELEQHHNVRIVMTDADTSLLYRNTNRQSNQRMGATVIYDEQTVFYDVGLRLKGSPHGRNTWDDKLAGFNIQFHPDHLFRGVHPTISIERGTPSEIIANHLFNRSSGGLVSYYNDIGHIITPRTQDTGKAVIGLSRLSNTYLDSQFENGGDGTIYNMDLLFQPTTTVNGNHEGSKLGWPTVNLLGERVNLEFQDLGDNKETYRWSFQIRNNRDRDDFGPLIELGRAFELTGPEFDQRMSEVMDVDQWIRTFAMQALSGSHDDYPGVAQHNFRAYQRPIDGRMVALPWDIDGSFTAPWSDSLWRSGIRAGKLIESNKHAYYGHLLDLINTSFNPDYMNRWILHYGDLGGPDFRNRTTYIAAARKYITDRMNHVLDQLPENIPLEITTNNGTEFTTNQTVARLQGNGWIDVRELRLADQSVPLTVNWLDDDSWETTVALQTGANTIELVAFNYQGHSVGTDTIMVTTTAQNSVADSLRVTEVHYHPYDPTQAEINVNPELNDNDFEFIELANISDFPVDLLDVRLVTLAIGGNEEGVDFDFSTSTTTTLSPGQRVVIVEDIAAFRLRYGDGPLVAGQWSGGLNNKRETISLSAGGTLIQQFAYQDTWHPTTDGQGSSLVIANPNGSLESWKQAGGWSPSGIHGGSPGENLGRPGDSNSDGIFNSADLVLVFQAGGYEDDIDGNSSFVQGDWNGDGDFTSQDLVLAFTIGDYIFAANRLAGLHANHIASVDLVFSESNAKEKRTKTAGPLGNEEAFLRLELPFTSTYNAF